MPHLPPSPNRSPRPRANLKRLPLPMDNIKGLKANPKVIVGALAPRGKGAKVAGAAERGSGMLPAPLLRALRETKGERKVATARKEARKVTKERIGHDLLRLHKKGLAMHLVEADARRATI
eukprot:430867-Prorocentrum_lima.AAC.1